MRKTNQLIRLFSVAALALVPAPAGATITNEIRVPGAMCALDQYAGGTQYWIVDAYDGRAVISGNNVNAGCVAPATMTTPAVDPSTVDRAEMYVYDASASTQAGYALCFSDFQWNTYCGNTAWTGVGQVGIIWLLMPRPAGTFNSRWRMHLKGVAWHGDQIFAYSFQDCTAPGTYCP